MAERRPDIMTHEAPLAPATIAKLEAFNSSRSVGSCSRGCTSRTKLHWWGVQLGDPGCRAFGELVEQQQQQQQQQQADRLTNLLLGSTGVGDGCMQVIAGLAERGHLSRLRSLGLSRNRISDAGCETLATSLSRGHLSELRELYLSDNGLGDACVVALGKALAAPRGPRYLEKLSANELPRVSVAGFIGLLGHMRAAGDGYNGAPRLRELSMRNMSRICADAARRAALLDALGALQSTLQPTDAKARRTRSTAQRRRLHIILKAPACKKAAHDPRWEAAASQWSTRLQQGGAELRVSVSR